LCSLVAFLLVHRALALAAAASVRTAASEEYGGGTSGGALRDFLPQIEAIASHYKVPLVVFYEAITHDPSTSAPAPSASSSTPASSSSPPPKLQVSFEDRGVDSLLPRRSQRRRLRGADATAHATPPSSLPSSRSSSVLFALPAEPRVRRRLLGGGHSLYSPGPAAAAREAINLIDPADASKAQGSLWRGSRWEALRLGAEEPPPHGTADADADPTPRCTPRNPLRCGVHVV